MSEKINVPIIEEFEETYLDDNGDRNDEGGIVNDENDDAECATGNSIPPRPKRPLTSYNLFAIFERAYILQNANKSTIPKLHPDDIDDTAHLRPPKYRKLVLPKKWFDTRNKPKKNGNKKFRQLHGVISFVDLTKTVSKRWRELDEDTKSYFVDLGAKLVREYDIEVKEYTDKYGHHAARLKSKTEKKIKKKHMKSVHSSLAKDDLLGTYAVESKSKSSSIPPKTTRSQFAIDSLSMSHLSNFKASGCTIAAANGVDTNDHHTRAKTKATRIESEFRGNKRAPAKPCNAFNLFLRLEKNFMLQTRHRDRSLGSILAKGEEIDDTDSSTRPFKYSNIVVPKNWFLEDTADFDWVEHKSKLSPDLYKTIAENWETLDTESRSYFINVASFLNKKYEEKLAEFNTLRMTAHSQDLKKRVDNNHSLVRVDAEGGTGNVHSNPRRSVSYFAPQHRRLRPMYMTINTPCVPTALMPQEASMPYMHTQPPMCPNNTTAIQSSVARVPIFGMNGPSRAIKYDNHLMHHQNYQRRPQYEMQHPKAKLNESQSRSQNYLKSEIMNYDVTNVQPVTNYEANRLPIGNAMHDSVEVRGEEKIEQRLNDVGKKLSSMGNGDESFGYYNATSTRANSAREGIEPQPVLSRQLTNIKSNFPWTDDEDSILFDLYKIYGEDWAVISCLLAGRTEVEVRNRWLYVVSKRKKSQGFTSQRPDHDTDEKSYSNHSLPPLNSNETPEHTTLPPKSASTGRAVNSGRYPSFDSTKRKHYEIGNSQFADADDDSDAAEVFDSFMNASTKASTKRIKSNMESNQFSLDDTRAKFKKELQARESVRDIVKSFSVLKKRS